MWWRAHAVVADLVRRAGVLCGLGAALAVACDGEPGAGGKAAASASAMPGGLTPELAAQVLAQVGDRTITLGDYAAVLERMDRFERLRYQSPERRRLLLDEIIRVELLAAEARRRGLDRDPETNERVRQVLRDELLRQVRAGVPGPEAVPEAEVRSYYDEHRVEFQEPERRRVAAIVFDRREPAESVLEKAQAASPTGWGELVRAHGGGAAAAPLELAGDLGIVSLGERGQSPRVPEAVRQAVFKIADVGGVHSEVVEVDGKYYVVRLIGRTDARTRSFADAARSIRVTLVQRRIREAERQLEQQLREKYPVRVDDAALARVNVPSAEQRDAGSGNRAKTP